MSDMLSTDSSGGAGSLPPNDPHDEFLELCATATTGSLRLEERRRLKDHLAQCAACREVMAQYEAIIDRVIPAWGPEPPNQDLATSGWSPEDAEAQLFARLRETDGAFEQNPASEFPRLSGRPTPRLGVVWNHLWLQFAAALLLVAALGIMAYRVGMRKGTEIATRSSPPAVAMPGSPKESAAGPPALSSRPSVSRDIDGRVRTLQSELADALNAVRQLKTKQTEAEVQLSSEKTDQAKLAADRDAMSQKLQVAQQNLEAAEKKLEVAESQSSQQNLRSLALEQKVDELTASIEGRDQEMVREREVLNRDHDIRELMGSRDLYIAEVYDVAKTGVTEKPFGRVFYTKGKSLIFYAFDLDQQKGIEPASTFQAWGRVGPDRDHAVNLGILFEDNASKKRWVLKSENPKTLAQIDAVFVTVEPNGGSEHPSGKPLLFAYLKVQPNHP